VRLNVIMKNWWGNWWCT